MNSRSKTLCFQLAQLLPTRERQLLLELKPRKLMRSNPKTSWTLCSMILTNKMLKNLKRQIRIRLSRSLFNLSHSAKRKRCKISTLLKCLKKLKYQKILSARKDPSNKLQSLLKNNKLRLKKKLRTLNPNQLLIFLCTMKKRRKNHQQLRKMRWINR